MTIEAILERIAVALERQAEAAPAAEAPPKRGPGRPVGSTKPVEPPAPSVPTAVVPPPAAPPEDTSFLDDEPAAPVVLTADDVRKALINYGKKPGCSQEKARALLKEHGHVDTLKALKPEHFKAVIDAAGV